MEDCLKVKNYICQVPEIDCGEPLPEEDDGFFIITQVGKSDVCGKGSDDCVNTEGGFECSCSEGYGYDEKREWCVPQFCLDLEDAGINSFFNMKEGNCTAKCGKGT